MAGYGVEKLILFGSRARNEATEDSDRNYPLVREGGFLADMRCNTKKGGRKNPCHL